MIINALANRRPLYRLAHYFFDVDGAKPFGPAVTVRQLNDDAMGRALDTLAAADPKEVYATVALGAVCHEDVSSDVLHTDTTSVLMLVEGKRQLPNNPQAGPATLAGAGPVREHLPFLDATRIRPMNGR